MKLSERALNFAMRAHDGQVRKSEKDKPMIIHPMIVGDLLKYYGYDDNVVAAGYLHDVVEDTKYTIEDISRLFGGDVTGLVLLASEPDKDETWEIRKKHTIKISKDLPERNKAVICADKIANLEDSLILLEKNGELDFSAFKRGKEDQQWYYEGMFNSLSSDFESPMIDRLYEDIQKVFYSYGDDKIKNKVFEESPNEYKRVQSLLGYRDELQKLKSVLKDNNRPYIIEFTGTPKSGKTSIINVLNDFFKEGGFKVKVLEEPISSERFKKEFVPDTQSLSVVEKNLLIASTIESNLVSELTNGHDIIITDRGMFDRLIWLQRLVNNGTMSEKDFNDYLDYYLPELKLLTNHVVVTYTTPITSVKRDYHSSISLDERFHNDELFVKSHNEAIDQCYNLINGYGTKVDTTDITNREATLCVAETLLPIMREDYIRQLKLYINEKKDKN
jgi:hypothetical protein